MQLQRQLAVQAGVCLLLEAGLLILRDCCSNGSVIVQLYLQQLAVGALICVHASSSGL